MKLTSKARDLHDAIDEAFKRERHDTMPRPRGGDTMKEHKVEAVMAHCLACKMVVWAHDSGRWGDVRGLLNAMRLPCRLCGDENEYKGYDGWTITTGLMESYGLPSAWMTMHQIAEENGLGWDNSPDLAWFSEEQAR